MALLLNDPSLSPNKQIKNPKRKTHHLHQQHHYRHQAARLPTISRQSSCSTISAPPPHHVQLEMVHASIASGGVFLNHYPNNQFSLSSSLPPILPTYYQHHHHQPKINPLHPNHQPPLLPLPAAVSKRTFHSLPPLSRRHSLSPPGPGKTKRSTPQNNFKKENNNYNNNNNSRSKELLDAKTKATKDPSNKGSLLEDEATKEVSRIEPGSGPTRVLLDFKNEVAAAAEDDDNKIMDMKFTTPLVISLSPPPSSLPLPRFPLRKLQLNKLSCNAEAVAGEVDSGATDNLCRLLKLR